MVTALNVGDRLNVTCIVLKASFILALRVKDAITTGE
jgi:hypothetical protein